MTGDSVIASADYIRRRAPGAPNTGIILGSGLGDFVESIPDRIEISTQEIPHYPQSTVEGHKGRIILAPSGPDFLMAFQGRVHFYESGSVETVLYPIQVAYSLGVKKLIVTNAAGAINRAFSPGDLMVIVDQINLTGVHYPYSSVQGSRDNRLYSTELIHLVSSCADELGISLRSGVYAGLKGPSYETAAEIEMLRRVGADAVGMSTVLEVSLAAQFGMEVLGISCITNFGTGIGSSKLSHAEVTDVGNRVKKTFAALISSVLGRI